MRRYYKAISIGSTVFITAALIVGFVLYAFAVRPAMKEILDLERQIAEMRDITKAREILLPLTVRISEKIDSHVPAELRLEDMSRIPKYKIGTIPSVIAGIAEKHGLTLTSVVPNVSTIEKGTERVMVSLSLKGLFSSFRAFLLDLGRHSALESIQEISIMREGRQRNLAINVWMAVE